MIFYVLNSDEKLVETIQSPDESGVAGITAIQGVVDEKISTYELIEMVVPADSDGLEKIEEEMTIIFKDISGWREYIIYEIEDIDGNSLETTIKGELSSSELIDEVIERDIRGISNNPKRNLEEILDDTRWLAGQVDSSLYSQPLNIDTNYMNVLEALNEYAKRYSAEIRFRYEVDGNKVVRRYVDVYKQFGEYKGKIFEIDRDMTSVKRTVNTELVKTTIIPYSKELEKEYPEGEEPETKETYRIGIEDVEWKKSNGDPVDKPLGQNYLVDPVALERWGKLNADGSRRHKKIPMEFDFDNAEAIINMAWVQLGRYTQPRVSYEVSAIDLYTMTGDEELKHEQILLGDTGGVKDYYFSNPLEVQTRLVEVKRDLFDPRNNDYVFGDPKKIFSANASVEVAEEMAKDMEDVITRIENAQISIDGKTKVFRGSEVPVNPEENNLWFRPHPSKQGHTQMMLFNGANWEIYVDSSDLEDAGRLTFGTIDGANINVINLIADNITGGQLKLENGIEITHKGIPILRVNNDGEVEMNISKVTINSLDIEEELERIQELEDGKDAYELAVENGFEGTIEEWLESLKGPKGDTGEQGIQGPKGVDGQSQYVHMRYSSNSNGSGFVPTPNSNTKYIGIAVTSSSTAPTDTSSYTWSKFIGEDGSRGIQGPKGTDGKTTYTWVKYADDVDGNGISDSPSGKMFIGLAFNKETESESNNPNDYQWSAMYDEEAFKGIGLADKTEVLSGTEIYTDKADDSVVHVEIDGNSYQHSKDDSKNLAPHPEHWVFRGGATYDEISNIITLPVRAEIEFWVRWDENTASPRLSFDTISGSGFLWNTAYFAEDKKTTVLNDGGTHSSNGSVPKWSSNPTRYVHTSPRINNNTKWIRMVFSGHETYTPSTVKIKNIMVVSGSSTEYEPPAPTPDHPIEIHSLNDFDVVSQKSKGGVIDGIKVGGRNYWALGKEAWTSSNLQREGDIFRNIGTNTSFNIFRLSDLDIPIGEIYTASFEIKALHENLQFRNSTFYVNGVAPSTDHNKPLLVKDKWVKVFATFDYTAEAPSGVHIYFNDLSGDDFEIRRFQVEKGNKPTDWTPAPEDITEDSNHPLIDKINLLLSEPLRSVGDVKDRLFRDSDSLWKIERNVGEFIFGSNLLLDNTSNVTNNSTPITGYWRNFSSYNFKDGYLKSTHFEGDGIRRWNRDEAGPNTINRNSSDNKLIIFNTHRDDFKDINHFNDWLIQQEKDGKPVKVLHELAEQSIETLDQELQDKLNNLRSFQDSNYVYTIINDKTDIISEKLKPTLHATFKGGGWYNRWKTEQELERHQGQIDSKADQESLDEVSTKLSDFETIVASREELGEVTSALYDYIDDLYRNELNLENAKEDIDRLLTRLPIIENNLGAWVERWSFLDTYVTLGNEGLLISEMNGSTGIRISKDRIDFMDGSGEPVAYITNQVMRINRGIFVDSMQVGEHKVETIADGHTIWQWMGG